MEIIKLQDTSICPYIEWKIKSFLNCNMIQHKGITYKLVDINGVKCLCSYRFGCEYFIKKCQAFCFVNDYLVTYDDENINISNGINIKAYKVKYLFAHRNILYWFELGCLRFYDFKKVTMMSIDFDGMGELNGWLYFSTTRIVNNLIDCNIYTNKPKFWSPHLNQYYPNYIKNTNITLYLFLKELLHEDLYWLILNLLNNNIDSNNK
jgi:hypothetical protein